MQLVNKALAGAPLSKWSGNSGPLRNFGVQFVVLEGFTCYPHAITKSVKFMKSEI